MSGKLKGWQEKGVKGFTSTSTYCCILENISRFQQRNSELILRHIETSEREESWNEERWWWKILQNCSLRLLLLAIILTCYMHWEWGNDIKGIFKYLEVIFWFWGGRTEGGFFFIFIDIVSAARRVFFFANFFFFLTFFTFKYRIPPPSKVRLVVRFGEKKNFSNLHSKEFLMFLRWNNTQWVFEVRARSLVGKYFWVNTDIAGGMAKLKTRKLTLFARAECEHGNFTRSWEGLQQIQFSRAQNSHSFQFGNCCLCFGLKFEVMFD